MAQQNKVLKISHLALGTVFVIYGTLSLAILMYAVFTKILIPAPNSSAGYLEEQSSAPTILNRDSSSTSETDPDVKGVKTINWWQSFLGWLNF